MILQSELDLLFSDMNEQFKIQKIKATFMMSPHSFDRINDSRNIPTITINEMKNIFNALISDKIDKLKNILRNSDVFTIFAYKSDIDIWFAINSGGNIVIKSMIRHNINNKYAPILKINA